jgi:hypothetical protein
VPSEAGVLPTWRELRDGIAARCAGTPDASVFLPYLDPRALRLRRPLPSAVRAVARALPGGDDLRRIVEASDADLSAFLVDQICGQICGDASADGEDEGPASLMFKRHNQLPCTAATLRRRVEAVRRYAGLKSPILIVGDDDLQSLALAGEGFTDITVVEIDDAVTREIATAARAHPGAITVIREDIGRIGSLGRSFAAILMDPPVNIDGARAFLDGAVRAAGSGETTLFLNTHLLSYGEVGYGDLLAMLEGHGFEALELRRAFSRYAIPRLPRIALNALLRMLEPRASARISFFVSDLVVLRRAA